MSEIGQRIRDLRQDHGYSLSELAGKAGLSPSYLSEIERAKKRPSPKTLDKLGTALNLSLTALVGTAAAAEANGRDGGARKRNETAGGGQGTWVTLGDKIRIRREEKGWTLKRLGEQVGLSDSYLSEIERGRIDPSVDTLRRLAEALDLPVPLLFASPDPRSLGTKIRDLRESLGLTQARLAELAGVTPGMIGQLEKGRARPSLDTVELLARALGVSPCYLILEQQGLEEMLQAMRPELRSLLMEPQVQKVLRMVCTFTEKELRFVLRFILLFKTNWRE